MNDTCMKYLLSNEHQPLHFTSKLKRASFAELSLRLRFPWSDYSFLGTFCLSMKRDGLRSSSTHQMHCVPEAVPGSRQNQQGNCSRHRCDSVPEPQSGHSKCENGGQLSLSSPHFGQFHPTGHSMSQLATHSKIIMWYSRTCNVQFPVRTSYLFTCWEASSHFVNIGFIISHTLVQQCVDSLKLLRCMA